MWVGWYSILPSGWYPGSLGDNVKQGLYRVSQFYRSLTEQPAREDLERAETLLPSKLFELFTQMQPFEQAHVIRVMDGMISFGYDDPEVQIAALLHDVGKVKHPIRPWERTVAVIVRRVFPNKFHQWGQGKANLFGRAIVVAARHAEWGAELSAAAGASQRVVRLIRNHDADLTNFDGQDRLVLSDFQAVDAAN